MRRTVLLWLCAIASLVSGCVATSAASSASPAPSARSPWHAARSGTHRTLFDVSCLSATRCEAVGAAGTILGTRDGGRSWHAQRSGTTATVYRIACAWPATCYAIARPATILVTHNGGVTWRAHNLRIPGVGTSSTVPGCSLSTTIPGQSRPCEIGLLDIACQNAVVCYAVASSPAAYTRAPDPRPGSSIWISHNAGATWSAQRIPAALPCAVGDCGTNHDPYPLYWVSCLRGGLCRAGGNVFLSCGHCGFMYAVFATTAPGAPWKLLTCVTQSPKCTAPFAPDMATCPTASLCYGVTSSNPFGSVAVISGSRDGGASWPGAGVPVNMVLSDIACPAARTCVAVGDGGTILRGTNGVGFGSDHGPVRVSLRGITCVSTAVCYAVGDAGTIVIRR